MVMSSFAWGDVEPQLSLMSTIDLDTFEWAEDVIERHPEDSSIGGVCHGADVQGTAVFARLRGEMLRFHIDDGSGFRTIQVEYPATEFVNERWNHVDGVYYDESTNEIALRSGNWPGDCGLVWIVHTFPADTILDETQSELSWIESGARLATESPTYGGRVVQVGGRPWQQTAVEQYDFELRDGICYAPSRWGAAPLNGEIAEFPGGYPPALYFVDGEVLAEVPMEELNADTLVPVVPADWFRFSDDGTWVPLAESPAVPIAELDGTFASTLADPSLAVPGATQRR